MDIGYKSDKRRFIMYPSMPIAIGELAIVEIQSQSHH